MPSQIIIDVRQVLVERGHEVAAGIAEEELTSLNGLELEHDVYLLKSYTPLSLSLAGALKARGARLLNDYSGCMAIRNKIVCYQMLAEAGVPVPKSWVTEDLHLLRPLLRHGPLIVKPYMGWRGEGICLVRNEKELTSAALLCQGTMLVQEYVENDGYDLRLYVAGNQVFGIRKAFSSTSFGVPGKPIPVSEEIREIALRCGHVFGLHLYGLDLIEGKDGVKVVDVNYFPGYKGVPNAAEIVANYIESYARSCVPLAPASGPTLMSGPVSLAGVSR